MKKSLCASVLISFTLFLAGCSSLPDLAGYFSSKTDQTTANIVEIRAVGLAFEAPQEIPSGWTTFRFVNASDMTHFAMIDIPPEGVTAHIMAETSVAAFQEAMDAMNAGDDEGIANAFAKFPEWMGDMRYHGGPGFLSGGLTGETTIYLEPGYYILECYVKTGGVFHTVNPDPGQLGMVLEFTVTDEKTNAPEPSANAIVVIRNDGLKLSGIPKAGLNTFRVEFEEQQVLPTFVGNDVHLLRVEADEDVARAAAWLDWRSPKGLETPAPVIFLGGINDMSAGSHGYFSVDLTPGKYALIAEAPDADEAGMVIQFAIE